ncbi:hypothetical protein N9926_01195 [Flavobacteriaceae bacterium]|nr:hypothetical protein [Flavobacteriaceae bacterium]
MKKQMEMFEEGGLKDDGTSKDPVSGNDVPSGSMAKEVRDDIPAQLSEGEYVVPADVVRFYGVKFFEDLRMEAKMGLASMEKNGRIGGEPVAVAMISMEEGEKKEVAKGGLMGYAPGGNVTSTGQQLNQSTFNPGNFAVVGGSLKGGTYQPQANVFTIKMYGHPDGRTMGVPHVDDKVQKGFIIPDGFVPQDQLAKQKTTQKRDEPPKPPEEMIEIKGYGDKEGETFKVSAKNHKALLDSSKRLNMDIGEYYNLSISQRLRLIPQELKGAFPGGSDVDPAIVQKIVDDKDDSESLNIIEGILGIGVFTKVLKIIGSVFKGVGSLFDPAVKPEVKKVLTDDDDSSDDNISPSTPSNETLDSFTGGSSTTSGGSSSLPQDEDPTSDADKFNPTGKPKKLSPELTGELNQGGLLTKRKPKTVKPRGKGLASK